MCTRNKFEQSFRLFRQAQDYLAGGVSSHFRSLGKPHPLFFSRGSGCRIVDCDGNEYIDYTLAQGPLILGHCHPEVTSRVQAALATGQLFAAQTEAEVELGRRLTEWIPGAERVRFCNSGSEAVHAALRLARAVTGKSKMVKFAGHYHGWLDDVLIGVQPPFDGQLGVGWGKGLPPDIFERTLVIPWNDLHAVERIFAERQDIAAVISEPIMCNNSCIAPVPGFLQGLRSLCDRHGALLIFDEIITGFRLSPGGAQQFFGVIPDLSTFGKAMASGFPIAALVGKSQWMDYLADGRVIHAGTMNANGASVAAALATLEVLSRDGFESFQRLRQLGRRLAEGLASAARETGHQVLVQGPGPMFHLGFTKLDAVRSYSDCRDYDLERQSEFVFQMLRRGIRLIGRGLWYVSLAHTEGDLDQTLKAAREVFNEMRCDS